MTDERVFLQLLSSLFDYPLVSSVCFFGVSSRALTPRLIPRAFGTAWKKIRDSNHASKICILKTPKLKKLETNIYVLYAGSYPLSLKLQSLRVEQLTVIFSSSMNGRPYIFVFSCYLILAFHFISESTLLVINLADAASSEALPVESESRVYLWSS